MDTFSVLVALNPCYSIWQDSIEDVQVSVQDCRYVVPVLRVQDW